MTEPLVDQFLKSQKWLDKVADFLQHQIGAFFQVLGDPGTELKSILHGTKPLGHPLHPALTDIPIGAWATGVLLDYLAHFNSAIPTQAGDVALVFGLVAAIATAATGLTDYHETYGQERRVATAHGLTMVTVVILEFVSLALRWWGSVGLHPVALILSTLGFAALLLGAYLGGHLVYGFATMVSRTAFMEPPAEAVDVGSSRDFPEAKAVRVNAGGLPVLVLRRGDKLLAIAGTCSHAGGPLDEGKIAGDSVTCPWHGSQFNLQDGRCLRGPATFPQPSFTASESEGRVWISPA